MQTLPVDLVMDLITSTLAWANRPVLLSKYKDGKDLNLELTILPVPLSADIVSRFPAGRLIFIIGGLSTALGGVTLVRLFL